MLSAAANAVFHPAASGPVSGVVVHAAPWNPLWLVLACALGVDASAALARAFPVFCAMHALGLSLALYLALAGLLLRGFERSSRHLLCDGRWLGYCSRLLGMVSDLEELAAVEARIKGRGIEIVLRARDRELLRLQPGQWRVAELRKLLGGLMQARPALLIDDAARQWLRQG